MKINKLGVMTDEIIECNKNIINYILLQEIIYPLLQAVQNNNEKQILRNKFSCGS